MTAAERWRSLLEEWAIPEDLLAEAEEDPYSWPVELWERRRQVAENQPEPFTASIVRRYLNTAGSVVDVGAGTGRSCLMYAREGHRVTAVERNPGMAEALKRAAHGLPVEVVVGGWPDVADRVGTADVVTSSHVVYDVADVVPFLAVMSDHAKRAVVLEMTERHPWADLAEYYEILHGLKRPEGPTADDLADVVREALGVEPQVARWSRPSGMWYADWDELLSVMGRRLVLPRRRWPELERLLASEVTVEEGRLYSRRTPQTMVTLWWEVRRLP